MGAADKPRPPTLQPRTPAYSDQPTDIISLVSPGSTPGASSTFLSWRPFPDEATGPFCKMQRSNSEAVCSKPRPSWGGWGVQSPYSWSTPSAPPSWIWETPLQTASPVALPQSPCRGVVSRYPRNMMIMTFLSLQEFYQHHLVQGLCHR